MQTPKLSALVFGLALAASACGDSMSSLNPTAPSSLSPDSLSVQSGAAVAASGSMAKGPNPGNGNGNGNGNSNRGGNGNRNGDQPQLPGGSQPPGRSRVQLEGLISAIGNASVTVNGQLVNVSPETVIRHGNRRFELAELKVGDRVHVVAGRVQPGTSGAAALEALEIKLQNPGEAVEGGEEEPPPPPTGLVSVAALDEAAVEPGTDTASFRFTRTGDLSLLALPLTVTFNLDGSTATNGVDYQNVPLSVMFPANESTVDLVITPLADSLTEGVEAVLLTLVDAGAYELGSPIAASVTISDPPEPAVTITAQAPTTIGSNGAFGIFVLKRTGSLTSTLSVKVSITGTAANEYPTLPTTITFAMNSDTASVFFMTRRDGDTQNEDVTMTVLDGTGYDPGTPSSATITITP